MDSLPQATRRRVDASSEVVIDRPGSEVAAFAANPDSAPARYVKHQVSRLTTPPIVVGSQIAFVARFLGRRLAYTYEVADDERRAEVIVSSGRGSAANQGQAMSCDYQI